MAQEPVADDVQPDASTDAPAGVARTDEDEPPADDDVPADGWTDDDRKRVLVIALFVVGTLALALILAVFYSMPAAD